MNETAEEVKFGEISFSGKDIVLPVVKYDRIAVGNRSELYLVSVVSETQRIKAIRAILCGGAKASINAAGGKIRRPNDPEWCEARNPGNLYPTPEGYNVYTQKMGYGLAHAIFVTRTPGFMKVVSEESLWQELNDVRFTTPLLREWLPYIEGQLRDHELLENAQVFNVSCGILNLNTDALDRIVSEGIKSGAIHIENPRPTTALGLEPEPPRPFEYGEPVVWVDAATEIEVHGEFRYRTPRRDGFGPLCPPEFPGAGDGSDEDPRCAAGEPETAMTNKARSRLMSLGRKYPTRSGPGRGIIQGRRRCPMDRSRRQLQRMPIRHPPKPPRFRGREAAFSVDTDGRRWEIEEAAG